MSNIISTDVSDDLKEKIEAEQEEGESRSAAVRRLVRRGLQEDRVRAPHALVLLGTFIIGTAITPQIEPLILLIFGVILAAAGVLASRRLH